MSPKDHVLMRIGGYALAVACLMVLPASYVIVPWLMGVIGVMPMAAATRNLHQVEELAVPFVLVWTLLIVLAFVGRAARNRLDH